VDVSEGTLRSLIERGNFTAMLYMQCATVCRFEGLSMFLDERVIREAARTGMPHRPTRTNPRR
jgi:hypothetical protein